MSALDHLTLLESECTSLVAALAVAGPDVPVPCCPGWTTRDLGIHVLGVQRFWRAVVGDATPDRVERSQRVPDPPGTHAELLAALREAGDALVEQLATTPPETPVWTFATERTARFVARRQAHETLIHRIDAEQAAGTTTPVDAVLAADGVDEMLTVLYGDLPDGMVFTGGPGLVLRVETLDTGDGWTVAVGAADRSDGGGRDARLPRLAVLDAGSAPPVARVRGRAEDLDRWFWHRAPGPVELTGDPAAHAALAELLAEGIRQ